MKKVIIGCTAGALALGLLGMGACFYVLREQPHLTGTLEVPASAIAGEPLDLKVALKNEHASAVTLDSIDIDDALLEGFQVSSVEPAAKDTMHMGIFDQRTWTFARDVPAGGTLTVVFHLKALAPGHYSGNVEHCNPAQDCQSLLADVVIEARP